MRHELIIFLVMACIAAGGSLLTKNDRKWTPLILLIAAVAGSLTAGMGVRFREIVEGPFAFLDSAMWIFMATIFVWLLYKVGFFHDWFASLLGIRSRTLRAFALMFFLVLPGMLSGLASLSVLTTGRILGEHLKKRGLSDKKAGCLIAVGSFLGMILPPNCLPAMLAVNGAGSVLPTPYIGFSVPMLLIALPSFVIFTLLVRPDLAGETEENHVKVPFIKFLPLIAVGVLLLFECVLYFIATFGGQVVIYCVGLLLIVIVFRADLKGEASLLKAVPEAMGKAVIPIAVMMAVGMFAEVTSMSGIRGWYSLLILKDYDASGYIVTELVVTGIALLVSIPFGLGLSGFFATYAVFPIQWIGNAVALSGMGSAYGAAYLLAARGGLTDLVKEELGLPALRWRDVIKSAILPLGLHLLMSVLAIVFADSLTGLLL